MSNLDFIFDFASPNAYLSHKVMPQIAERTGATINYIPCLLGGIFKATNNQAPMIAFGNIKGKLEYDRLEMQRFVKKHALDKFSMNPHFPINTLLIIRGAVAMDMQGQLMPYIEAVIKAMWEEGKKMDDPEVVHAELTHAGLDADDILQRTQNDEVKAKLMSNTQEAVDRGAFGVPTFFVDTEMFFGKDRLRDVEELLTTS